MYRIGFGNDIHRLEKGRKLILGGVVISSDKGAVGHSDADALLHALTDALLGALALGDIGTHFSDRDDRWKNAESSLFLKSAAEMINEKGFAIENIDSTITIEAPKLKPFIPEIISKIAEILDLSPDRVSVKAKTHEQLDSIGTGSAVKAEAVVLLRESK